MASNRHGRRRGSDRGHPTRLVIDEIHEETGISKAKLKDMATVAGAFPPHMRIEGESFERHQQALRMHFGDATKARKWLLANPTNNDH
jgi:hypothetical protein